jgi:tetratricopeptide (TPR) repeat protein
MAEQENDFELQSLNARQMVERGHVEREMGQFAEARKQYQEAQRIFESLGDLEGVSESWSGLGNVSNDQGHFDQAQSEYGCSLSLAEEGGLGAIQSKVLCNLGALHLNRALLSPQSKHLVIAEECLQRALELHRHSGNDRQCGVILGNLGLILEEQGRLDKAEDVFLQSITMAQQLGDRQTEAIVLGSLSGLYQTSGRFDEALTSCLRSLAMHEASGAHRSMAIVLHSIGNIYYDLGEFEDALASLERAIQLHQQMGHRMHEGITLGSMVKVLTSLGREKEALRVIGRSVSLVGDQVPEHRSKMGALKKSLEARGDGSS